MKLVQKVTLQNSISDAVLPLRNNNVLITIFARRYTHNTCSRKQSQTGYQDESRFESDSFKTSKIIFLVLIHPLSINLVHIYFFNNDIIHQNLKIPNFVLSQLAYINDLIKIFLRLFIYGLRD